GTGNKPGHHTAEQVVSACIGITDRIVVPRIIVAGLVSRSEPATTRKPERSLKSCLKQKSSDFMGDRLSNSVVPSAWALSRFGDIAAELSVAILAALQAAHERALAGHHAMGLRTNDVYGQIWQTQHEEMV